MKLLWDFTIQCDRQIPHNRPDIVCVDYSKSYLIDVAIPGDSRVKEKVSEKHQRYTDLKYRNTEDVEYSRCYPSCHLRSSGINFVVSGEALEDFKHIL